MGTISNIMNNLKKCNDYGFNNALKYSYFPLLGYFLGNLVLFILPIIKAPLLAIFIWLPYANYIVHGMLVAIFVLFSGYMGTKKEIAAEC